MARPGGKEAGRVSVRVVPDSSRFNADLKKTLDRIEKQNVVRIPLEIETRQADVDIRRFQKKWNGANIAVDIDANTLGASAHLTEFTKKPRKVPLYVEVSQASLAKAGSLIAALSGGRLVGDLVTNVGSKLSNLDRSLPKITAVALGISGLSSVMFAGVGGAGALAVALTQLLGVAALIPAAFGAAGFAIGTVFAAFQGVGAALKQAATGASGAGASAASYAQQERQLANALQAEKTAQQQLSAARKQAVLDLRDLSNSVTDASLAQRQGVLDLAAAQDSYNQILADPSASQTARDQAKLDLDQATQNAKEQSEHLQDLQKQQKAAAKAGVDGAANVVAAQQALKQAQDQVLDAQVKNAAAASATVNAFAELTPAAQEAVGALLKVKAMLSGIQAVVQQNFFEGFSSSLLNVANVIVPELRRGMGALATDLGSLSQELFRSLQASLGGGVLQGMLSQTAAAVRALTPAIAPLIAAFTTLGVVGTSYLPEISTAIASAAATFDSFIQDAASSGALQQFITTGIAAFQSLGGVISNLASIIGGLFSGLGAGGALGTLATTLGQIAAIVNTPAFQGTLQTVFQGAVAGAAGLATALAPIGQMLTSLAPTIAGVLAGSGQALGGFLSQLAAALSSPVFASGLATFFSGIESGIAAIAPALPALAETFATLAGFVGNLAAQLGPILGVVLAALAPILTEVLQAVQPLLPVLGSAFVGIFKTLAPILAQVVTTLLPPLISIVSQLVPLLMPIVQAILPLISALLPPILAVINLLTPLLQPILELIKPIIQLVSAILVPVLKLITPLIGLLTPVITAIADSMKFLIPIISGVAGFLGKVLTPAVKLITSVLGDLIRFITDVFQGKWGDAWKAIEALGHDAFVGLVKFGIGVVNGLVDLVNGLTKSLNDVTKNVGIPAIPKIPHIPVPNLAEGATVLPRSGGTLVRVAEAGRPESVVDTGMLNQLIAQILTMMTRGGAGGAELKQYIETSDPLLAAQQAAQMIFSALKVRPT